MKPQPGAWREHAASLLLALLVATVLVLGTAHSAPALQPVPPAAGYVTDLTGTLDAAQDAALEQQLAAFEARKGSQVAVLIVPTIAPEAIEDYAMRVAEQWKPGRRQVDDGAILVIVLRDRQLRIEVGYGLEGMLTDAVSRRIIDETLVPKLRAQDLHGAVTAGVDRITRTIDGEALPLPDAHFERHSEGQSEGEGWTPYLPAVAMAAWVLGMVLRRLMARPAAAAVAAGLAGGGAWWLTGLAAAGWAAAAMAAAVVLFGGFIGPRGPGLPWNGSGRGGGGGSGGGGGGFRGSGGGGGGFGGGGASGRW